MGPKKFRPSEIKPGTFRSAVEYTSHYTTATLHFLITCLFYMIYFLFLKFPPWPLCVNYEMWSATGVVVKFMDNMKNVANSVFDKRHFFFFTKLFDKVISFPAIFHVLQFHLEVPRLVCPWSLPLPFGLIFHNQQRIFCSVVKHRAQSSPCKNGKQRNLIMWEKKKMVRERPWLEPLAPAERAAAQPR